MAFKNFKGEVWSAEIELERERLCVFAEDCNTDFEGVVEKCGDSVKVLGVGQPKITVITKGERKTKMPDIEEIEDSSVTMYINQMAVFNYKVDDIDAAQAKGNIKGALNKETSQGIADAIDRHIAAVCVGDDVEKLFETPKKLVSGVADPTKGEINILTVLDVSAQRLYEKDVHKNTVIVATLTPAAHRLFKEAYRTADTNNHEELKNGRVGMYNGMIIKMSNNVRKTQSGNDEVTNISVRTRKAVAFANPLTHTEAYRPEKGFSDAVKGYSLFQAQVVRPKEAINANVIVPAFSA